MLVDVTLIADFTASAGITPINIQRIVVGTAMRRWLRRLLRTFLSLARAGAGERLIGSALRGHSSADRGGFGESRSGACKRIMSLRAALPGVGTGRNSGTIKGGRAERRDQTSQFVRVF
jgi:hypothetical protein